MDKLIKKFVILVFRLFKSFYKGTWGSEGLKVLIVLNDYFNESSWKSFLKEKYQKEVQGWNIIFCKNKFDIYRYFPKADICFIFGYGFYLENVVPSTKLLYFPTIGLDFLDNKQIPVGFNIEKPPAYSAHAIAEYAIAMSILMSRNLHYSIRNQLYRKWDQKLILKDSFVSISSKKIGILGVGNVGRVIAENFKKTGCFVAGLDKNVNKEITCVDKWYQTNELDDFLEIIDILVISLPLSKNTRNFIGVEELKKLGQSSYLINVSRGNIINEKDLIKALKSKIIKGAVLDTFSVEPLSIFSKFYNIENLIITPHISGNIHLFIKEIQDDFLNKALKFSLEHKFM